MSIDSALYEKFMSWYSRKKILKNIDNGKITKSDERVFRSFFFLLPRIILIPIFVIGLKYLFINYYLTKYGFEKTIIIIFIYYVLFKMVIDLIIDFAKKKF